MTLGVSKNLLQEYPREMELFQRIAICQTLWQGSDLKGMNRLILNHCILLCRA